MQVFLLLSLIIVILLININLIESKKNDIKEIKYKNKNDLKKKLEKETKNRILADEDEISPSQKKKLESEELNLKRDVMRSELNYGVDSIEKATSLHKLGRNMYQQGKYHDLKELSKEIVRIHEVVDGTDHVNVANALGNVGSLSFRIGDTRECEVSMQRALYILIEEHGVESSQVLLHRGRMMTFGILDGETSEGIEYEEYLEELKDIKKEKEESLNENTADKDEF